MIERPEFWVEVKMFLMFLMFLLWIWVVQERDEKR